MTTRAQPAKRKAGPSDNAAAPKKLRCSISERPSLQSDTTTVFVGRLSRAFPVDNKLLRTSCDFFHDQPLTKKGKHAGSKQVRLPDNTIRAFELYLGWLQTGCFYIVAEEDADSPLSDYEPVDHSDRVGISPSEVEREKWYECYLLGQNIQDHNFQDACIDLAQEKIASGNQDMMIAACRFYKTSPIDEAHRKFAVTVAAHLWNTERFELVTRIDYPKMFLEELVAYIGPRLRLVTVPEASKQTFFKNAGCQYHAHTTLKKPCYKETHPAFK
ncbi:uncharacterized protein J4E87_007776 [Alternaria ethzedia]|uniref:uncharacterized protein n=1 Tax=Alternaria ethzedia TaxID=181014 RepID=UPI0020C4A82E|nr:uncharacterized protein J4E87_007776 [Alternaria ethzedia]KAI4619188.1 hypothetical protein J4E87_007776 [Alternaria ethzedia]